MRCEKKGIYYGGFMCGANKKDPRNALASWNGYEFQGQIAIIVILEM